MGKRSLLVVEDDPEMRRTLSEGLSNNGYMLQLAENAGAALRLFEEKPFDLVISDVQLPDMNGLNLLDALKSKSRHTPVIMMTGFGTVKNAVEAMKKGAFDFILKPFSLKIMEQLVESALQGSTIIKEKNADFLNKPSLSLPIITQDRRMKEIIHLCQRIAASKATVLIQGESGTGKELFARDIHAQSQRNQGPFVAVNCASLPETLLESELFGHEKGAFTGAIGRKIGKFELAHRGTILLDEIGEMNTFLQAKILRVLQESEVDRIGGNHPVPIDIRVIATTNRNLETSIEKGEFREDLYYRLNVIALKLSPLRERPEDIELLAVHFLKEFSENYRRPIDSISETALSWLKKQEWRGNVRELKNRIERAVLMANKPILDIKDFSEDDAPDPKMQIENDLPSLSLREMEQNLIFKALEKTEGNRTHAAKILGISIRTLRNKLNEYKMGLLPGELS
ncbi:MAG: sigma-54-dependent Fis family transcriptional regulator [Deltaproteobacteria bacterium]|nr:sigma-54-dependent Fis family transcriptional regulator [Deltaproteobacteria bacterium]